MNRLTRKVFKIVIFCAIAINLRTIAYAGDFYWPLSEVKTTDPIYYRTATGIEGYHAGWDLGSNDPNDHFVYAIADGIVRSVGYSEESGYFITIEHTLTEPLVLNNIIFSSGKTQESADLGTKIYSKYLHLAEDTVLVSANTYIKGGMPIAIMGNTGNSTGPHLHFAISNTTTGISKYTAQLFAAESHDVKQYATEMEESDFKNNKVSFNCLMSNSSFVSATSPVYISPNYLFGNYTVVDVPELKAVNTIRTAKQKYKVSKEKGIKRVAGKNKIDKGKLLPAGVYTATIDYMHGTFNPERLTKTADAVTESRGSTLSTELSEEQKKFLSDVDQAKIRKDKEMEALLNPEPQNIEIHNFAERMTEEQLGKVVNVLMEYLNIFASIFIYIGIISIGIGLILKRNNAEERTQIASSLLTLGIGAFTIGAANLIAKFFETMLL